MRRIHHCISAALVLGFLHTTSAQGPAKKPDAPAKEPEWVTYDEKGVNLLIRYLKEGEEPIVLFMAMDTLARMGPKAKPAVPALIETVKHPNGRIRIEAARTLIDLDAETEVAFRSL